MDSGIQTTETPPEQSTLPLVTTNTILEHSTLPPEPNELTTEALEEHSPLPTLTTNADPVASAHPTLLPVTNTQQQTTETLELPILQVTHTQTNEIPEHSTLPSQVNELPVANTQTNEVLEHSTLPSQVNELPVDNTNTNEVLEHSTLPSEVNELPVANTETNETFEHSTLPSEFNELPVANSQTNETSEHSVLPSEVNVDRRNNSAAALGNHEDMEMRPETAAEEEAKSIMKVIAATGKFWHDWEKLRSMLSIHLKQVLSEYPEVKMTTEEQNASLGETHVELVKRLDDALHSFVEGPPFTLQRLCEIILDARSLYPNLSKLALALEKNLLVTSTLTISTDPYPSPMAIEPNGPDKATEDPNVLQHSDPVVENGAQSVLADRDEEMSEVEADVGDDMAMDMETFEDIVRSSESGSRAA